jgi:restriction system protein
MPLPTQTEVEIPLLTALEEAGGEAIPRDVYDRVAQNFPHLTEEDLQLRMDSGAVKWWNHVQWARQRLVQKGEIDGSVRGVWRITPAGRARLGPIKPGRGGPPLVARRTPPPAAAVQTPDTEQSPDAVIETAHRRIGDALAEELLQLILGRPPRFFEQLVIDLLVKMGYGGNRKDAGETLGRTGDGGIDGIIKEDRLALGVIYVQAKRWTDKTVGRPDLHQFSGALRDKGAQKGVFITTSTFSNDAKEFAARSDPKIALVDGRALAGLMIEFGLGVTTTATYEIKRVDSDYFGEE